MLDLVLEAGDLLDDLLALLLLLLVIGRCDGAIEIVNGLGLYQSGQQKP